MMVHFVGAGSGDKELITLRGMKLMQKADVVIYAGSLVNPELLDYARPDCRLYDSARMTLEDVMAVICGARDKCIVRLHTGDPSLFGAIREQMDELDKHGIRYDVTPGVSSFLGAAASLCAEYTLPGISQTVILTRMAGRTPVPQGQDIASLAAHGASMAVFLSAGMLEKLAKELEAGGYAANTPAAIVYKATWPDEKRVRCTVGTLAQAGQGAGIDRTALILVGGFLEGGGERSKLYDPAFETGYRKAET